MARPVPEEKLKAIEEIARSYPDGITAKQISSAIQDSLPFRTLQYRLKYLADKKRLVQDGKGRWAKYRIPSPQESRSTPVNVQSNSPVPISSNGTRIQNYIRQPLASRMPVSYERKFLDSYRPNVTFYLSSQERDDLLRIGKPQLAEQPAGTYARQMLNRLLIELSWNSSRLEGNTYSLLDTKRLIELGQQAEGKEGLEAQMILNHKDAIEFLVNAADEIGFNSYTVRNLHAMLANNLLADPGAGGRIRRIGVGIEKSVFHPLETPQLIEECFNQLLATVDAIRDPFEQAFFVMVQVPYLQPFDDVNKRLSRLAANIPLIKGNFCPLSFIDVPQSVYLEAVLGVYELREVDLLKDVFIWAYKRSANQYAAIRQSLGEPDPFRQKHRNNLLAVVRAVIQKRMDKTTAAAFIAERTMNQIEADDRSHFREIAENELLALHEGNFARYQILPSEFEAWQRVWTGEQPSTS